jgi:hypothetical protein
MQTGKSSGGGVRAAHEGKGGCKALPLGLGHQTNPPGHGAGHAHRQGCRAAKGLRVQALQRNMIIAHVHIDTVEIDVNGLCARGQWPFQANVQRDRAHDRNRAWGHLERKLPLPLRPDGCTGTLMQVARGPWQGFDLGCVLCVQPERPGDEDRADQEHQRPQAFEAGVSHRVPDPPGIAQRVACAFYDGCLGSSLQGNLARAPRDAILSIYID